MVCPVQQKLKELNLALPAPRPRFDNRLGAKKSGEYIFVSGHPSELKGAVGSDVTVDEAYRASRELALGCISTVRSLVDSLDDIVGFEKITGFVRSAPDFTDQSRVIHGCSDLIVELFGERGMHARSAIGVAQLPNGSAVEIEMTVRVKP